MGRGVLRENLFLGQALILVRTNRCIFRLAFVHINFLHLPLLTIFFPLRF